LAEAGRFIVFEGGEGTGKSTQARLLADALRGCGIAVVLSREPGGAAGAEALRRLLLDDVPVPGWSPMSEALLHYAARNEHLEKTIKPVLGRGSWVVCDRFADSTAAYQGAALGLGDEAIATLSRLVLGDFAADLTLVLDLPVEPALARAAARSVTPDRYESMDLGFHQRVRQAFLTMAGRDPARHVVIDAGPEVDQVRAAVQDAVRVCLGIDLRR
jgi:dTMP kinase